MTKRNVLYALAVIVLTGSMAVAALAEAPVMNAYGPADSSVSAQPGQGADPESSLNPLSIRGPMETGAVPDLSESSSESFKTDTGEEPTVEIGGRVYRPSIDLGS